MTSREELERQVRRLQEELAEERSKRGTSSNDLGVAARVAITRLRDDDFPELVAAVEEAPNVAARHGRSAALAYCRTHLRSLVDAIILQTPRTADLVRSVHRIHAMLSEGQAELMIRSDAIGERARVSFVEVVERYAYSLSIKAAFAHGAETPREAVYYR